MQLHIPYSEHAKVPVGPLAMGLAPAMDPKKLGKDQGLVIRRPHAWSICPRGGSWLCTCSWGRGLGQRGLWTLGLAL